MTENGTECSATDPQTRALNIMYTTLSLLSFAVGLIALILNRCYYCPYKDKRSSDPTEDVFFIVLVSSCVFELSDCFQWFVQFDNFVGCDVLGAIREYAIISLLAVMVCLGTHVLILMWQPKFLSVINEVKAKRHKIIQKIYLVVTFLLPIAFVPWPFIGLQYGKQGYVCWLRKTGCGVSSVSNVLNHLFLWYLWALLAWLFAVAVFALFLCKYCCCARRGASTARTWRPDLNSTAIMSLLTVFVVQFMASAVGLVWGWVTGSNSFPAEVFVAVVTPVSLLIFFVILIVRQVSVVRVWGRRFTKGLVIQASYQSLSQNP